MRIAMLLHKHPAHDSRVRREARALRDAGHEVTVIAPLRPPRRLPLSLHRLGIFWSLLRRCLASRPDVVHAHDVAMLAPAWLASRLGRAALVYDSHELATGVPYRSRPWALYVRAVERLLIGSADAVITVSGGIAARLRELYGLEREPVVVRNVCELPPPGAAGQAADLRAELGIGEAPLVLHQGAVGRDRGAELLIEAVAMVPNAHLLFLGATDPELREAAAARGVAERVHTLPPAPLDGLLALTAQADVGVSLLQDTCENHRLALPNKVFEYLAAGVPVVASELPELRALLERTGAGRSAPPSDAAAVAGAIAAVLAGGRELRERAAAAGRELSWERERVALLACYEAIAGAPSAVVLVRNPATHDGRVLRVARSLRELGHDPVVLAVTSDRERRPRAIVEGVPVVRLRPRGPLARLRALAPGRGRVEGAAVRPAPPAGSAPALPIRLHRWLVTLSYYRRAISQLGRWRPRIVHCNDYNTMWPGLAAKYLWGAELVYDSHELWPDRNGRTEPRWWLLACEALFVRAADEVVTTSPGHAQALAARHRVREPRVVRNLPDRLNSNGAASATRPPGEFVYAGAVTGGRGLETAIAALAEVPRARLRVVGPGNEPYRQRLLALAAELGVADRVELAEAVPPGSVVAAVAGATAGLALIEPVCRSYELSLPNKVFEYLAAGLPILASDLPVIGSFVRDRGLGVTVPAGDPAAAAAGMRELLRPDRNAALRQRAERGLDGLSWQAEIARR